MKRTFALILSFLTLLWCAGAHAAGLSVESGVQQEYWEDTRDSSGSQTLVPLRIEWNRGDATIGLLTGAVHATLDSPGAADRSLTHTLDTKLNLSYVVAGETSRRPPDRAGFEPPDREDGPLDRRPCADPGSGNRYDHDVRGRGERQPDDLPRERVGAVVRRCRDRLQRPPNV